VRACVQRGIKIRVLYSIADSHIFVLSCLFVMADDSFVRKEKARQIRMEQMEGILETELDK